MSKGAGEAAPPGSSSSSGSGPGGHSDCAAAPNVGPDPQHGLGGAAGQAMSDSPADAELDYIWRYHTHEMKDGQCGSILVKHINAPVSVVWSLVRRFDQPERYKRFIQSCTVKGDGNVGSIRDLHVVSGLPATRSTERLEILDDKEHVFSYRILDGDHRLQNYWSIITLHAETVEGRQGTVAIESYVVDTPEGNTKEDTCFFVETVIKCNLKSLADVSERIALQQDTERLMRISDA